MAAVERIFDRHEAFMRTSSPQMRKFLDTYPPKRFVRDRPGAGRSFTPFSGRRPALQFNKNSNSMYLILIG
jgi:hypothetical protein